MRSSEPIPCEADIPRHLLTFYHHTIASIVAIVSVNTLPG